MNRTNTADSIRAGLAALAAAEECAPSRVWDPVTNPFTAEQVRLCHEATEFDHQCVVCSTENSRPDHAIPGTDY